MHSHLGTSFTVWSRRRSWFWMVLNQNGNGGMIGTAATEAEAIRDACSSIEEMPAQLPSRFASPGLTDGKVSMPTSNRAHLCSDTAFVWMDRWMSVACWITDRILIGRAGLALRSS